MGSPLSSIGLTTERSASRLGRFSRVRSYAEYAGVLAHVLNIDLTSSIWLSSISPAQLMYRRRARTSVRGRCHGCQLHTVSVPLPECLSEVRTRHPVGVGGEYLACIIGDRVPVGTPLGRRFQALPFAPCVGVASISCYPMFLKRRAAPAPRRGWFGSRCRQPTFYAERRQSAAPTRPSLFSCCHISPRAVASKFSTSSHSRS